jgi:hypothetical protein
VQLLGISIHTFEYRDPDGNVWFKPYGYPVKAADNDTFNPTHSIVPGGQLLLSVPTEPVGPCNPFEPDTNNFEFA